MEFLATVGWMQSTVISQRLIDTKTTLWWDTSTLQTMQQDNK